MSDRQALACARIRRLSITSAVALTFLPLASRQARGDGGHIALHATSGAYSVTLFTAPYPLVSGPVDLSLLVQDASSGAVLGDATATASLGFEGGRPLVLPRDDFTAEPFTLTHQAASNKLLLAATRTLSRPGTYTLTLQVERPGSQAEVFSTSLQARENHKRRTTLIFALLMPLAIILLFLINQRVKRKALMHFPF